MYLSSVQAVKETYSACLEIRKILQRARVTFEERDISLDSRFNKELQARLPGSKVPQLFLNGKHVGVWLTRHCQLVWFSLVFFLQEEYQPLRNCDPL